MLIFFIVLLITLATNSQICTNPPRTFTPPTGNVTAFYNMFNGDPETFESVVKDQVRFINTFIDRIDRIHVVYFGKHHSTYHIPSHSHKYVLSPASAPEGDELVTQSALYTHCQAYPTDQVIYMHTKGSYHPNPKNHAFRRHNMRGVRGCIMTNALSFGDVCGTRTTVLPHPHYSGNMWVARCDYVRMLPNPEEFRRRINTIDSDCPEWATGKNRYSVENWILSHPLVVPLDVFPTYTKGRRVPFYVCGNEDLDPNPTWRTELQHFPRQGMSAIWYFLPEPAWNYISIALCSAQSYRLHEYRHLYGQHVIDDGLPTNALLCKWKKLVSQMPRAEQLTAYIEDMLAAT
jgi:hypothetical protein